MKRPTQLPGANVVARDSPGVPSLRGGESLIEAPTMTTSRHTRGAPLHEYGLFVRTQVQVDDATAPKT